MAEETKKTNQLRSPAFFSKYLAGKVIDIGCADDLVVAHAEPFDLAQGNAQFILDYRKAESYDCVYSSHCLEHMKDVPGALEKWWRLVKPGGYMVLVVPEENLYEQGEWPSKFNPDHKASFRIGGINSWSPVSYDLRKLVNTLTKAKLISLELQDQHYIQSLKKRPVRPIAHKIFFWRMRSTYLKKCIAYGLYRIFNVIGWQSLSSKKGKLIDQTLSHANAQVQLVLHKTA